MGEWQGSTECPTNLDRRLFRNFTPLAPLQPSGLDAYAAARAIPHWRKRGTMRIMTARRPWRRLFAVSTACAPADSALPCTLERSRADGKSNRHRGQGHAEACRQCVVVARGRRRRRIQGGDYVVHAAAFPQPTALRKAVEMSILPRDHERQWRRTSAGVQGAPTAP